MNTSREHAVEIMNKMMEGSAIFTVGVIRLTSEATKLEKMSKEVGGDPVLDMVISAVNSICAQATAAFDLLALLNQVTRLAITQITGKNPEWVIVEDFIADNQYLREMVAEAEEVMAEFGVDENNEVVNDIEEWLGSIRDDEEE